MHHTLFISDLHLEPTRPDITAHFCAFLQNQAQQADALYILGDLFEAWIGDDDLTEFNQQIFSAIEGLTKHGVPVYFIRGNRDFLISQGFAKATGCQLLADPTVIRLYGKPILLAHGDAFCTADPRHQTFRRYSQSRLTNRIFLLFPLAMRKGFVNFLRNLSRRHTRAIKEYSRLDVVAESVQQAMESHDVNLLIHGHTHKPAIHDLTLTSGPAKRIVLGDWGPKCVYLRYEENGECRLVDWVEGMAQKTGSLPARG